MAARKASPKKKTSAKKSSARKSSAKKASAKKSSADNSSKKSSEESSKKSAEKKRSAKKQAASASESGVSSTQVVMGHIFALRPRVNTGFRPDDLRRARQVLAEDDYASIYDAARAVAEKAIEINRGGPQNIKSKPKKRF